MKRWIGAAAVLLAAGPAMAADVATCTLSADKKTVTVTASNPYSQVMACEVNCHMAIPNGIATVVCAKPVPVGAKDFAMCSAAAGSGQIYTGVKEASVNCPDPVALLPKASKDDDDDDAKADEMMQKMLKQGQEFLDRQKEK
jgi:hypothetical protein